MVPVKSEVWNDQSFAVGREPAKRLRLVTDSESRTVKQSRSRRARARAQAFDNFWFTMAIGAILVFAIAGAVTSIRSNIENALDPGVRPCVIGVTVKSGDTLWTYARRYGAPESYILDRVDAIARENGLDPSAALVPGQTLRVNVENPLVIAKLQHSQRLASVAD